MSTDLGFLNEMLQNVTFLNPLSLRSDNFYLELQI